MKGNEGGWNEGLVYVNESRRWWIIVCHCKRGPLSDKPAFLSLSVCRGDP